MLKLRDALEKVFREGDDMIRFVILEDCSGCLVEQVRTRCGWGLGGLEA